MDAIIRIDDVTIAYGQGDARHTVLRSCSLDVRPGEFLVLFGASGVGKSTLLRAIAGLHTPAHGTVSFPSHRGSDPMRLGFVFQEDRLFPWRRVCHNVELGMESLGLSRSERKARALELLETVGLAHTAQRWPRQLSGGQRQRVGIARALAVEPEVLLMDEPFSSLDYVVRTGLHDEVLRLWRARGVPVVFVTHDVEEALRLADRIVVLGGGNPARIFTEIEITLPRPRHVANADFQELIAEVRGQLLASARAEDPGL